MAKPKTDQSKTDDFKQQVDEVLKPLTVSAEDQAPTIPFAPYANDEYCEPYAPVLLEKVNALAAKIWTGREGYDAQKFMSTTAGTSEELQVIEKNKTFFDYKTVSAAIRRFFSINLINFDSNNSYTDHVRITELIKKLKKLEKKYDNDEIIDENAREQLITNILMPSHMYGIYDQCFGQSVQLRYPMQKSIANELLTMEDMTTIESLVSYIPRVRSLLASFQPASGYPVKKKRLLAKWMLDSKSYTSISDEKRFLKDLLNLSNFFNCALPHDVCSDMVPALKYPTVTSQGYDKLRKASADLRNEAITYVQKQESLSALLQATVDLSEALQHYFSALTNEVEACFHFINRTGIAFDKLVEESKLRIDDSGSPF